MDPVRASRKKLKIFDYTEYLASYLNKKTVYLNDP